MRNSRATIHGLGPIVDAAYAAEAVGPVADVERPPGWPYRPVLVRAAELLHAWAQSWAPRFDAMNRYHRDDRLEQVIDEFHTYSVQGRVDEDEIDATLSALFDWADDHRVTIL